MVGWLLAVVSCVGRCYWRVSGGGGPHGWLFSPLFRVGRSFCRGGDDGCHHYGWLGFGRCSVVVGVVVVVVVVVMMVSAVVGLVLAVTGQGARERMGAGRGYGRRRKKGEKTVRGIVRWLS